METPPPKSKHELLCGSGDVIELDVVILPSPRIRGGCRQRIECYRPQPLRWQIILEAPFFQNTRQLPHIGVKLYIFA